MPRSPARWRRALRSPKRAPTSLSIEVDPHTKRILATGQDYRAVNPLGYVPALRLDDGTVLTEKQAILNYVADALSRRGASRRPRPIASGRAKLRQWLSFIGSELHKGFLIPLLRRDTPPEVKAWTLTIYGPRLAYLDGQLAGREFLLDRSASPTPI